MKRSFSKILVVALAAGLLTTSCVEKSKKYQQLLAEKEAAVVENQNIANLTFSEYTAEEKSWIELAQNKDNYLKNPVVDYLMVLSNRILNLQQGNAARPLYTLCNGVWVGGNDTSGFEAGRQTYVSATTEYTKKITELYKSMTGAK